ncbi:MAG: endopeptidase La [Myxococcales bacterium]|nr:endopeptidase La [Myxococcales bacterium]
MSTIKREDDNPVPVELPVLPLRNLVLLPGSMMPIEVGRRGSLRLLDDVVKQRPPRLLVATQRSPEVEDPEAADLHPVVVEAELMKLIRVGPDRVTAVLRGVVRRGMEVLYSEPYLVARTIALKEVGAEELESQALMLSLRDTVAKLGESLPKIARELVPAIADVNSPSLMADLVAAQLDLPLPEMIELLQELNIRRRLELTLQQVQRRIEVIRLKERIDGQVREEMSRQQREAVLRQSLKAIQEELGEGRQDDDLEQFEERIAKAGMPPEVEKVARRQLARIRQMVPAAPEYTVQRTYLEWLCDLPWSRRTEDRIDLQEARTILEEDHHGLDKVKKRFLEYLAVRKLAPHKKGPILCLVGPPGVGKTSLGRSVARALGREFVRMSLGGVRDEAEVRGHRRTYIGALPGRIIQAMKRAGTRNPVMLLDEIDKLGSDHRGDPSAALLEVLDPEQNNSFSDHYLEVPFDLSEVIFIGTANRLETIPPALLDRMEVIEIPGYTQSEKRAIAQQHLIPKQLKEHGLRVEEVSFTPAAIDAIIERYTREAGVRNLERELAAVIRGVAMKVASNEEVPRQIEPDLLAELLGPPRYQPELAEQLEHPGVATGLAWTPAGGDLLFVEASGMQGKGNLHLTGHLGAVMKESAQAALSWVRAHAAQLGLQPEFFEHLDIHLHVPQGGVPKDGPSAGVAMVAAIVSLLTQRRVRSDVAMTGEITLRGAVLPVGGIKEKVLAAHRAGIRRVVLPERNRKDLVDVPPEVTQELQFVFVKQIGQAVEAVLEEAVPPLRLDISDVQGAASVPLPDGPPAGVPASATVLNGPAI